MIGDLMSRSLFENLTAGILPDGKMYYNITQCVLQEALGENGAYVVVSKYCDEVQQILNQKEKVGIKAITPKLNQDRVDGILDIVSGKNDFEAIKYMLKEPTVNFVQSIVDEAVRTNADFQYKAGLSPQIVRTSTGNCCEWCQNLAGTYDADDAPRDIFRRHDNCKCMVVFKSDKGKYTDVWTKEEFSSFRDARIANAVNFQKSEQEITRLRELKLKTFNDKINFKETHPVNPITGEVYVYHDITLPKKQLGKKIGKHAKDYGLNPKNEADRIKMTEIIQDIVKNADRRCYGEWRDQEYPVILHIKGRDVVIEDKTGVFVTILKGRFTIIAEQRNYSLNKSVNKDDLLSIPIFSYSVHDTMTVLHLLRLMFKEKA